jgi:hypothetical protein
VTEIQIGRLSIHLQNGGSLSGRGGSAQVASRRLGALVAERLADYAAQDQTDALTRVESVRVNVGASALVDSRGSLDALADRIASAVWDQIAGSVTS